jgi:hypothetical protein
LLDYRHIIDSLVRKPGAMGAWLHREVLFPTLVFRQAYDHLNEVHGLGRRADLLYLRLLQLAKRQGETEVALAIGLVLEEGGKLGVDEVTELVSPRPPRFPQLQERQVDWSQYDNLLQEVA